MNIWWSIEYLVVRMFGTALQCTSFNLNITCKKQYWTQNYRNWTLLMPTVFFQKNIQLRNLLAKWCSFLHKPGLSIWVNFFCFSGLNPSEDEVKILVLNYEQCTNCKLTTRSADYKLHHENSYARDSLIQYNWFSKLFSCLYIYICSLHNKFSHNY